MSKMPSSITGGCSQSKVDIERTTVGSVRDSYNSHAPKSKSPSREKGNPLKSTATRAYDHKVKPEMKSEDQMSDNDAESNYLTPTTKRTLAEHNFRLEKAENNPGAVPGFTPSLIPHPSSSKEDIAKSFQSAKPSAIPSEKKLGLVLAQTTTNREFWTVLSQPLWSRLSSRQDTSNRLAVKVKLLYKYRPR